MRHSRLFRSAGTVVMIVATIAGCEEPGQVANAGESVALAPIDTLVTTASERIGGVYDIAVSPDGDVYIADYSFKHILVVAPDGTVRRTIGKEGKGPGEFELPFVVAPGGDSVRVLDAAGNRVQVFDGAGGLSRSYRLDAPSLGGGRAFREDGMLAAAIDGFDGAMVMVFDGAGSRISHFGEPIVPAVAFLDFAALKTEIRDGRVPDAFRNRATVAWAPDHSVYLAFLAEPMVRRYDAGGTLLWTRVLDEPVLRSAREAFFRKNLEERNPARMHALQYVTDVGVVAGDLWLLLNTVDEDHGLLLVLRAEDGAVLRRFTIPGLPDTGFFVVDQTRRCLYMAPPGEASVLVFDVSGA